VVGWEIAAEVDLVGGEECQAEGGVDLGQTAREVHHVSADAGEVREGVAAVEDEVHGG
jgi:hypothetical protein